ncbi:hypothetical protein KAU39_06015, partial [bacterium]|nr:hypothetical protein [bacterium]
MEIKRFNKKKITTNLASNSRSNSGGLYLISSILLILIITIFFHRTGYLDYAVSYMKCFCKDRIKHLIAICKANPQQINIDIKYKDFQQLAYKRKIALAEKILISDVQDYVPAIIRYKNKSVKVKIRLKGDWAMDNLQGEKWSFRVRVRGDNTFLGMKYFSLHHPQVRNYIYEWIFHQALKREHVVSLRYEFIKVLLNGKNLGIYALEEHFGKRLIEHNQKREGVIIKFSEDILWSDRKEHHCYERDGPTLLQSEFSSNINAFKMNRIFENPLLYKQFLIGKNLLESFRKGKLPTHKVFDIKKLAKYFAISEVMGGLHGMYWHNLRFYYNPITSFLEPVGFDAMVGDKLGACGKNIHKELIEKTPVTFYAKIFSDFVFFEEYIKALKQISDSAYLDELFLDIDNDLKNNLHIIYSEFPNFHFSEDIFRENQKHIRFTLNPVKGILAYFHKSFKDRIELQIGNIQSMPVEVLSVTDNDSIVLNPLERIILAPKLWKKLVDYKNTGFNFPENFIWSREKIKNLVVNYKILGTDMIKQQKIFSWSCFDDNFIKNDFIRQESNINKVKFLIVEEATKKIFIKPGIWKLTQNLIIPEGYMVIGKEGLYLNLSNSAKILSYSPLKLIGSEEKPIIICSSDSTGQGIIVINSKQESILKHVTFDNLSNPSQSGWVLTGAVTFYNSPVNMQYCRFLDNNSEDTLNLIHSEFAIDKTIFKNILFDGIDSDFSKGEITNCSFINCGNDAIDFSGSRIKMQNVFVKGIGDKALSVGENSVVSAEKIDIKNAKIAIASKDMSVTVVKQVELSNCKIGFAVYQKKSEFRGSFMSVEELDKEKVDLSYIVEKGSRLWVEGKIIKPDREKVGEL